MFNFSLVSERLVHDTTSMYIHPLVLVYYYCNYYSMHVFLYKPIIIVLSELSNIKGKSDTFSQTIKHRVIVCLHSMYMPCALLASQCIPHTLSCTHMDTLYCH